MAHHGWRMEGREGLKIRNSFQLRKGRQMPVSAERTTSMGHEPRPASTHYAIAIG